MIVARGLNGDIESYIPVENRHKNHILDITIAPADILNTVSEHATDLSHRIVQNMDLVGLIAVEMFVTADGEVLVNELAPRHIILGTGLLKPVQPVSFVRAFALPLAYLLALPNVIQTL